MISKEADLKKVIDDLRHDVRSPLQIIQSYAFLLQDDDGSRKKEFLAAIEAAVQKITDLLEEVRIDKN